MLTVDVETTGLSPAQDRIVELAAVLSDPRGHVLAELDTLIDPGCPVGATFVHGISDRDVRGAPRFDEVVADLLAMCDGAVMVAHNAAFDVGFVRAEVQRATGRDLQLPYLCTMRFRRMVGRPGASAHRLIWACWQEGISIEAAHAAACDARATGALAVSYLGYARERGASCLGDLRPARSSSMTDSWQLLLPRGTSQVRGRRPVRRRGLASPTPPSLLASRHATDPSALTAYQQALSDALEDFEITAEEAAELHDAVAAYGLSASQVRACHRQHLAVLLAQRAADGLLTWAEQQELRSFGALLGFTAEEVAAMMATSGATVEGAGARFALSDGAAGDGMTVCFTGPFTAMPLTREEVQDLAREAGMAVAPGVSRRVDILVCDNPSSQTSKARKARELGTVVVDQQTFLALAGAVTAPERVVGSVLRAVAERRERQAPTPKPARPRAKPPVAPQQLTDGVEMGPVRMLWCEAGAHEWARPAQRGRLPRSCPEHRS